VSGSGHPAVSNRLVDLLPPKVRASFLSHCVRVDLNVGETLVQPGETLRNVYFPEAGFVTHFTRASLREKVEVALVGNEGMVGIPIVLESRAPQNHAVEVQGNGSALKMTAALFRRELASHPALRVLLGKYVLVRMNQLEQAVRCNRRHVVEQRLARWLLMSADRAHSDAFRATHESIADMLGVRRVGVTGAAMGLQSRKLIQYFRGNIAILNRRSLESAACNCYQADIEFYERLLSPGLKPGYGARVPRGGTAIS
jgi:CRP-like cAMP-binding protein